MLSSVSSFSENPDEQIQWDDIADMTIIEILNQVINIIWVGLFTSFIAGEFFSFCFGKHRVSKLYMLVHAERRFAAIELKQGKKRELDWPNAKVMKYAVTGQTMLIFHSHLLDLHFRHSVQKRLFNSHLIY